MADTDSPASPSEAPPKSPLFFKLAVAIFVVGVIATECLVAYLFLPSGGSAVAATPTSAKKEQAAQPAAEHQEKHGDNGDKGGEKHGERAGEKGDSHESSANILKEVDLGEFTVTATQPAANNTLRITLHLFGTVSAGDEQRFQSRMKEIQHRFREQVLVTLRSAEVSDLTDAGLGLLKRTILEKTNALLNEPLLKMVIFSEFSFFEM